MNGTAPPSPAPSLRELSSECETEGVSYDERKRSKITEPIKNCEETLGPEQPSDDTPSVTPVGRDSSLREGAGGLFPFNRVLANVRGYGRFSSPLRKLRRFWLLPFIGRHSLREGAGDGGAAPFIGVLANVRGWRAIFIAPTKAQKFLHSTVHRGDVLLCCGKNLRRGAECGIVVATGGCRGNAIIWEEFG